MKRAYLIRVAAGIAILAVAVFLFLCLVSYSRYDTSLGDYSHQHAGRTDNLCGVVGAYIAIGVQSFCGRAVALITVCLLAILGLHICTLGRPRDLWLKLAALVVLVPTAATLDYMLFGAMSKDALPPGGILGRKISAQAIIHLGRFGAPLLVSAAALISFLLITEMVPYRLARAGFIELLAWRRRRAALKPQTAAAREPRVEKPAKEARRAAAAEKPARQLELKLEPEPEPEPVDEEETEVTLDVPVPRRKPKKLPKPKARPKPILPVSLVAPGPKTAMTDYHLPPVDLLDPTPPEQSHEDEVEINEKSTVLERTLLEFGIEAKVVDHAPGPVITQFEIELAPGIKITQVQALSDDIARALKTPGVRVVAPIPGKNTIGIEVPNAQREIVYMRSLFETGVLERKRLAIPLLLGKDAVGEPLITDLTQMPHLLIAGATGAGKSVCINSLLISMLMTQYPDNLKLILVDPKMVELAGYDNLPHLLCPVLTDMKRAAGVLDWACIQMDERYQLLSRVGVRNITSYNKLGEKGIRQRLNAEPDATIDDIPITMPYVVLIIDEFADVMMTSQKEVEDSIIRLTQKSRAVGIHLILATQRPSVNVITGLIKANLPCRLAFHTAQKVDSRTILDRGGADKLLGQGDLLFKPPGTDELVRAQGTYNTDDEIRRVIDYVKTQAPPQYHQDLLSRPANAAVGSARDRDDLYDEAVRIVIDSQRGSVSLLQRKLGIGYSRAARLIDYMAEEGVVGTYKGSQAREVLYKPGDYPGTGDNDPVPEVDMDAFEPPDPSEADDDADAGDSAEDEDR